ncbi:MAG: DsbA family protein [Pseudomonadota bacterium]
MRRTLAIALTVLTLSSVQSAATDEDFNAKVRAYILDNPEVIVEALAVLAKRERTAETVARLAAYPELFEDLPVHGLGDLNAPVRVIKFFDYKCVPCRLIHPKLVEMVDQHPELRVEMRHLPILTPGSERGARFALAVRTVHGDAAYDQAHEMLWDVRGPIRSADFQRISAELDLDLVKVTKAMDSSDVVGRIDYNRDVAIALGILGTPAFVTPTSVTFGENDPAVLLDLWLSQ